jgi:hypothetical protein
MALLTTSSGEPGGGAPQHACDQNRIRCAYVVARIVARFIASVSTRRGHDLLWFAFQPHAERFDLRGTSGRRGAAILS